MQLPLSWREHSNETQIHPLWGDGPQVPTGEVSEGERPPASPILGSDSGSQFAQLPTRGLRSRRCGRTGGLLDLLVAGDRFPCGLELTPEPGVGSDLGATVERQKEAQFLHRELFRVLGRATHPLQRLPNLLCTQTSLRPRS